MSRFYDIVSSFGTARFGLGGLVLNDETDDAQDVESEADREITSETPEEVPGAGVAFDVRGDTITIDVGDFPTGSVVAISKTLFYERFTTHPDPDSE